MALSYKEGGAPQFRPPPRLPGKPIPPVTPPLTKLQQLIIKMHIKKAEILAGIEQKKQEVINKAKEEIQNAIQAALGILKNPIEPKIEQKKKQIDRAKQKLDDIKKKKEELERLIQKAKDLYEKYKNLDEVLYAEAMKLINKQIEKYTEKIQKEIDDLKQAAIDRANKIKDDALKKLDLQTKKEKVDKQKKKLDNIKQEYETVKGYIEEAKELAERIKYLVENAEEEALKYAIEKTKPILEKKKEQLEKKIEPKKKELEKKTQDVKDEIARITGMIPSPKGALKFNAFSAGVTIYWIGAQINPAPGAPGGIIVLYPGNPIATFNPIFDFKTQGTDPAEPIRQLVPLIKAHLQTVTGVYLQPTGTPPFVPLPWVGYGASIEWESMFVQPVARGLENGKDSLGNLLADNYDRAIKTGFPNAPALPIPYSTGTSMTIKSLTKIADLDALKDMLIAMAYNIPIKPIEREIAKIKKKQEELQNEILEPIEEEKKKIEKIKEKLEEFQRKVKEYMEFVKEYQEWALEQQAAVAYYSDPANLTNQAMLDDLSSLLDDATDLGDLSI